jgi:hypothetical protein
MSIQLLFLRLIIQSLMLIFSIKKIILININYCITNYLFDIYYYKISINNILNKLLYSKRYLYNTGGKNELISDFTSQKIYQDKWFFLTGRNDNKNISKQICNSIESVLNKKCSIICCINSDETCQLLQGFFQSLYPIKTKFIYYCINILKKELFNNNINKIVLVVKTDEIYLLNSVLTHLNKDPNLSSQELNKIEYFYFNETQIKNMSLALNI